MTVKDIMTLLESPDRVRVIKDGEEIYNQYFANMEVDKDIVAQIGDAEVNRCGVHKHRTDTVRNIRRLLFKNGNGIRHRKNPDRCIRK